MTLIRRVPLPLALTLCVLVGVALQAVTGVGLPVTGDERNAIGIGEIWLRTGMVVAAAPGESVTSHSPAGAFVQVAFGGSQVLAKGVPAGRALSFLIAVAGALLMTACLWRTMSLRFAFWFLAAYWVAPWTMYHGAMAWEPALIMALAAVHFSACLYLRRRPVHLASAALTWSLVAAFQVHGQFLISAMSAAALAYRRRIRVGLIAAVLGLVVGSVTLWPGLFRRPLSPVANAVSLEHRGAHFGWGLVQGYPLLRAAGFWLRMGSSDLNRQLRENRIYRTGIGSSAAARALTRGAAMVAVILSFGAVLVSAVANLWFLRRPKAPPDDEGRTWLRSYALATMISLMAAAAASPVCIQGYHAVAAMAGASIPFAAWCEHTWSCGSMRSRWLIAGLFALRVLVILFVAVGREL
jgi:hypothetical protein